MSAVWTVVRYAWAAPATSVGLLVVLAGRRRTRVAVIDGVLEAHGPLIAWMLSRLTPLPGGVAAMTLGHVVIARDGRWLDVTRAHEREHVRQYEVWGPLFVPAYLAASLWAALRGRHFYRDNWFESTAMLAERHARTSTHV